ncbi:MAG: cyclase family protein [Ottowia sp.]|uniref:cyclase family protein n=1 Tax=Ottowia sp. TaxID=1898956 RepID=UPI0039E59FAD
MAARQKMQKIPGRAALKMHPRDPLETYVDQKVLEETARKVSNWNRWGPDDEIGTLNFVTPEDIVKATALVKRGKSFALALPFDQNGPQNAGGWGMRFNPIHTMTATGTDAVTGQQGMAGGGYADDIVTMPLQCGTQWDGLGHVFFRDKMWNGYHAKLVDAMGAAKNGIEKTRSGMVGRGVLLDIARYKGADYLEPGYGISNADLEGCAKAQGVEVRRGDFLICRTGIMEQCLAEADWGSYAGGASPGMRFETAEWLHAREVAAIATDTWGCEVIPNETTVTFQPWHQMVIPMMGITMGEIFYLEELAKDCAADGVYEFLFVAPTLPITGAVGSPVNPQAIK